MKKFTEVIKLTGRFWLLFNFLIAFIVTIIFNYFEFKDNNIIHLLTVIALPIMISNAIYFFVFRERLRDLN